MNENEQNRFETGYETGPVKWCLYETSNIAIVMNILLGLLLLKPITMHTLDQSPDPIHKNWINLPPPREIWTRALLVKSGLLTNELTHLRIFWPSSLSCGYPRLSTPGLTSSIFYFILMSRKIEVEQAPNSWFFLISFCCSNLAENRNKPRVKIFNNLKLQSSIKCEKIFGKRCKFWLNAFPLA